MPPGSMGTSHLPRTSTPRSITSQRIASPAPSSWSGVSITPTPNSRPTRPPAPPLSGRPRWHSSSNTGDLLVGHNFKPLSVTTPSPYRKQPPRTPRCTSSIPLPSPLSRETSSSPAPITPVSIGRQSHLPKASPLAPRVGSPSPAPSWAQQQQNLESSAENDAIPSARSGPPVAKTSVPTPPSSMRTSLLPQPKGRRGRESALGGRVFSGGIDGDSDKRPWR